MSFTKNDLLLTDARMGQLEAALANTGVPDPLQAVIDEAVAEVTARLYGYSVSDLVQRAWIRAIALYRAWAATGSIPEEVKAQYEQVQKELVAIGSGERPNLPRVETPQLYEPPQSAWGSDYDRLTPL